MNSVYRTSPLKQRRRTKAEIATIKERAYEVAKEDRPVTLRQLFYRLVSIEAIEKTENEYKCLGEYVKEMRMAGELPFRWLTDNTRLMRKPDSFTDLGSFLDESQAFYRRALWHDQDAYVEIWLEKDALSGVLYEVTARWDVALMVTRGFSSITFLHAAAECIKSQDKPCFLYYFGDWDPSGVSIPKKVEADLRRFAPDAELHFERVAVNEDQIEGFSLATRPTKKSDSRSKNFAGESVEVDALPPKVLRDMADRCIRKHIDWQTYQQTEDIEEAERATLRAVVASLSPDDTEHGT